MKTRAFYSTAAALLVASLMSACQQNGSSQKTEINDTVEAAGMHTGLEPINVIPVIGSPEFEHAAIGIRSANATMIGKDSTTVAFVFDVKNYNLKNQTEDAATKNCNNSAKGQHIHFILDNQPYAALYEPKHEVTLPKNTEHYLMCFLSRSYHESIKSKGAALVYHFKIDDNGKLVQLDEPTSPMLFYSRPKGDYLGADTANLLLDFYVWNASLGADYKVKTTIKNETNGQQRTIDFDTWQAMFIEHLGLGKSTVSISLVDKEGKPVPGPMTEATRTIQLAASEPLQ